MEIGPSLLGTGGICLLLSENLHMERCLWDSFYFPYVIILLWFPPSLRYHSGINVDTQQDVPWPFRYQQGPVRNQIQLYYSSFDTSADLELTPRGYVVRDTLWVFSSLHEKLISVCQSPTSVDLLISFENPSRCVEDRAAPSQRQLFRIKAVTLKEVEKDREESRTKEQETCLSGQEDEELSLDSHVMIRYHKGPVLIGKPIRVSVNLRANFSADFVVIRWAQNDLRKTLFFTFF